MIVLDTHAWIWYISNPETLSKNALYAIKNNKKNGTILISSISVWEIIMLTQKSRLKLSINVNEWIKKSESLSFFKFIPVNNKIAAKSLNLFGLDNLKDSADRMIIATSMEYNAPLITKDEKIQNYQHVETIW